MVFPFLLVLAAARAFPKFAGTAYNIIWAPIVEEHIQPGSPDNFLKRVYGPGSIGEPILNLMKAEAFTSFEDFAAVTAGFVVRGAGIRAGSGAAGSLIAAGLTAGLVKSANEVAAALGALIGLSADPAKLPQISGNILLEVIDQQEAGKNLLREITEVGTTLAQAIRDPASVSIGDLSHELQTVMGGVADFFRRAVEGVPRGKPAGPPPKPITASGEEEFRRRFPELQALRDKAAKGQEKLEKKEPPPTKPPVGLPATTVPPRQPLTAGRIFTGGIVRGFKFFSAAFDSSTGKGLAGLLRAFG